MNFVKTELPGVVVIEPRVCEDSRGFFMETFHAARFREAGLPDTFVQDNHSGSVGGTLRGLHYQIKYPQGKLIRCVRGEIFDVVVDLRLDSPTMGRWYGTRLAADDRSLVYVPPGMAHGFCILSEAAEVVYKCTDFYYPEHERALVWNDPEVGIDWPISQPLLSEKDRGAKSFREAEKYPAGSY